MKSGIRLVLLATYLLPLHVLANPMLVDSHWLEGKLGARDIAIVDMSDSMQYARFHIPGARHLPYEAINRPTAKYVSLSIGSRNIARVMGRLGITAQMHVIIYDDTGGLNASRLFWELERLGHQQLSLLDGGLVKWILDGKKVVAGHQAYPRTNYQPAPLKGRDRLAESEDLFPAADKTQPVLLDVRSEEEYIGQPGKKTGGHIPGAKWWHWEDNVDFDKAFQIQSQENLTKRAATIGLGNKQQDIIVYCRSGHRAAHTYFTLRHLGYTHIRLYDGSMAEYEQRRPAELIRGKQL